MQNLKACLLRDNRQSIIVFVLMFSALFTITGAAALYIKAALPGFGILIFLVSMVVVSTVRMTDKTLPRFISTGDDSLKFVYWDGKSKIVQFKDITKVIVDGSAGRSVRTIMTIKTKDDNTKVLIEVFDSAVDVINCLKGKIDIDYRNKFIEDAFKNNINEPYRKNMRMAVLYFIIAIFWTLAIAFCLNLPSMIH